MATRDGAGRRKLLQRLLPSWVAPWFTIPQLVIKILQLSCGVIVMALIASWDSNGVKLTTIIDEEAQEGAPYIAVLCVAACTQLYVIITLLIGFIGVSIPPELRTIIAGFFLLLWVITLPIMSAQITTSKYAYSTRIMDVNYVQLEASVVIGFLVMFSCLADVLTGLITLNKYQHKRFSKTDLTTKTTQQS